MIIRIYLNGLPTGDEYRKLHRNMESFGCDCCLRNTPDYTWLMSHSQYRYEGKAKAEAVMAASVKAMLFYSQGGKVSVTDAEVTLHRTVPRVVAASAVS